jgi:hypothetical protein
MRQLKHSLFKHVNNSLLCPHSIVGMGPYGARLAEALAAARMSRVMLARKIGVTPQAVGQVLKTGSFSATNNAQAARVLRVDPDWLATGKPTTTAINGLQPSSFPSVQATLTDLGDALRALPAKQREHAANLLQSLAREPDGPWMGFLGQLLVLTGEAGKPQAQPMLVVQNVRTVEPSSHFNLGDFDSRNVKDEHRQPARIPTKKHRPAS